MNVLSVSSKRKLSLRTKVSKLALACSMLSLTVSFNALSAQYDIQELATTDLGVNIFAQGLNNSGTALVTVQDTFNPPLDFSLIDFTNEELIANLTDVESAAAGNPNADDYTYLASIARIASRQGSLFSQQMSLYQSFTQNGTNIERMLGFDQITDSTNGYTFGNDIIARGINDSNVVVGTSEGLYSKVDFTNSLDVDVTYVVSDFSRRAFVQNGSVVTELAPSMTIGGGISEAYDINANMQVVGFSTVRENSIITSLVTLCSDDESRGDQPESVCLSNIGKDSGYLTRTDRRATVWELDNSGQLVSTTEYDLPFDPAEVFADSENLEDFVFYNTAFAINDNGIAVGETQAINTAERSVITATIYQDGVTREFISKEDYSGSSATDINNDNIITGYALKNVNGTNRRKGYFYNMATEDLVFFDDFFPGSASEPKAINNNGLIVGEAEVEFVTNTTRRRNGFVYDLNTETFTNLNDLVACDSPYTIVGASAINDDNIILANALVNRQAQDIAGELVFDDNGDPVLIDKVVTVQLNPVVNGEVDDCSSDEEEVRPRQGASLSWFTLLGVFGFITYRRRKMQ